MISIFRNKHAQECRLFVSCMMMCISLLMICPVSRAADDISSLSGPFFGQTAPADKAVIFLDGIISMKDDDEMNAAFSADGREFYFCARYEGSWALYCSREINGSWAAPATLPFTDPKYVDRDFTMSPDGNRLYFGSNRPSQPGGEKPERLDLFYTERDTDGRWSHPVHLGAVVNSVAGENYPSVATNGNLYFFSQRPDGIGRCDIYLAEAQSASWAEPVCLGGEINSVYNDWDSFIAPDESYIIFSSDGRPDTVGKQDLYICYRKPDGGWTQAINLGARVNSSADEICPGISLDGRFFFFTSRRRVNADIMWITTDIIDQLRPDLR